MALELRLDDTLHYLPKEDAFALLDELVGGIQRLVAREGRQR